MKIKFFSAILIAILAVNVGIAQITVQYIPVYNEKNAQNSKLIKGDYFLESINNKGDKEYKEVEALIEKTFTDPRIKEIKNGNWAFDPWISPVSSKDEAKIIITADYFYSSGADVSEKKMKEKSASPRLPYFIATKILYVDLKVVLTYNYTDGTPMDSDTIFFSEKQELTSGKDNDLMEELEEKAFKYFEKEIDNGVNLVSFKKIQYTVPKLKVKDKSLKEEYKLVKDLMKEEKILEAGSIIKRIYDKEGKPDQAEALGMIYELVGNYPKAAEMYEIQKDFHINSRMKKNMKMLEFARGIGYEPEFIEIK